MRTKGLFLLRVNKRAVLAKGERPKARSEGKRSRTRGLGREGEGKMRPDSIAREYFHLASQTPDCWSFQHHIQCKTSDMSLL